LEVLGNNNFKNQFKILINIGEKYIFNKINDDKKYTNKELFEIICELYELIQIINGNGEYENLNEKDKLIEARILILPEHLKEILNYERRVQLMLLRQWGAKHRLVEFFLGLENVESNYKELLRIFDFSKFV